MEHQGMVYLIGAGPGDIRLLTIGAKDAISYADVIVYDNLINEGIIRAYARTDCEIRYVGKSGASHTMEQDDINRLIAQKAAEGHVVARLKGGDPFIFGRGGEEALHLSSVGIPFEVICGVSSAYSVPAYAGIPVTHRGLSTSVAFITGHEDPTKPDSDIRWDRLATGVQTLVFLMGVKNLPSIVRNLVKNGLSPDTPSAVIQNGTYPSQKTVTAPLSQIYDRAVAEKIAPPSVFIVGDVVSLREKINWYETRPLFGKRIVVTRSREQASELAGRLIALGADVIEIPSIRIVETEDPEPVRKAIADMPSYDWIIFTSVNGVDHYFNHLYRSDLDARAFHGKKICAIGPATCDRLRAHGIRADLVPPKYVSGEIVSALRNLGEISGRSFLLPRADIAPPALAQELRAAGATRVDDVSVYRTAEEHYEDRPEVLGALKEMAFDIVTFTSSSTARNFAKALVAAGVKDFTGITCASIGPITTETASGLGFRVAVTSGVHTIEGLVDAILGLRG